MMTFTKEQLATLREASEAAKGDTTWQNLQAFHAAATPEVVLALLDALDASLPEDALILTVSEYADEIAAAEIKD